MFFEWLEKQRHRPEPERRTMTLVVATLFTIGIVALWLPVREVLDAGHSREAASVENSTFGDELSRFSDVVGAFQGSLSSLQDVVEEVRGGGLSEEEGTPTTFEGDAATTTIDQDIPSFGGADDAVGEAFGTTTP